MEFNYGTHATSLMVENVGTVKNQSISCINDIHVSSNKITWDQELRYFCKPYKLIAY